MAPNGSVLRTMTAAVATCAAGVTCFAPAFPCASNGGLRLRGAPQARVACRFVCESRFQLGVYTRHVLRSLSRLLTHTCTQIHTHTPSLSVSLSHTHTSTHRHTHTPRTHNQTHIQAPTFTHRYTHSFTHTHSIVSVFLSSPFLSLSCPRCGSLSKILADSLALSRTHSRFSSHSRLRTHSSE